MGVVYRAVDQQLNRPVALKLIQPGAAGPVARARLWREARAAAGLNHPHVCQVYEVGEDHGELFLTMELLEGEGLSNRLSRGPIPCTEAVDITVAILAALEAAHRRGLVHRDVKPSNVFLTPYGVKLLDFGLARLTSSEDGATETNLTVAGTVIGTPNYMAPEQVLGQTVDQRADLFAAGCVLFEMLAGKPPFFGESTVRVLHAITSAQPPTLTGSPAIVAVDQVIRRALSKNPSDRPASAAVMAQELRACLSLAAPDDRVVVRAMSRLMVLPFRMLRPDPSLDFLAFSLPDAVVSALSGLDSLIVRSSLIASRFAGEMPDWPAIAREADVDIVLTGTVLRIGEDVRLNVQLVETPGGTVVWTQSSHTSLGDLFHLQDQLTSRIVESLALPLTAREHRMLKHDVPATAKAYEFYLRANQAEQTSWSIARDLYLQCVQEDHQYAPAWARLGRTYRMLGKFTATGEEDLTRARSALKRALDINPDLSLAHHQYARLEIDLGLACDAMVRLIQRAHSRRNDPELFAALVQACRYCGLLDASVAAHAIARQLDALIPTSVAHTFVQQGQYQKAYEHSSDPLTRAFTLTMLDRSQDADQILHELEKMDGAPDLLRAWSKSARMIIAGRREDALALTRTVLPSTYRDPESLYYLARQFALVGERDEALRLLSRVIAEGFFCLEGAAIDPAFATLWIERGFTRLVEDARDKCATARAAYVDAEGDRLLALPPASQPPKAV